MTDIMCIKQFTGKAFSESVKWLKSCHEKSKNKGVYLLMLSKILKFNSHVTLKLFEMLLWNKLISCGKC